MDTLAQLASLAQYGDASLDPDQATLQPWTEFMQAVGQLEAQVARLRDSTAPRGRGSLDVATLASSPQWAMECKQLSACVKLLSDVESELQETGVHNA